MNRSATHIPSFPGPQHLVHKPDSPEAYLLGTNAPVRQHFAFAAELPSARSAPDEPTPRFHDLLFPVEALRRTALFAARQYFRVPDKRVTAMSTATAQITDVEPWRHTEELAHLALDLELIPIDVVTGVPRGLGCRATVAIDGQTCGTAQGRLVFLTPGVHRAHRAAGRRQSEQSTAGLPAGVTSADSPAPEQVGQPAAHLVCVGLPVRDKDGGLIMPVDTAAAGALVPDDTSDDVPAALYLEVSRQAALFAAAELHGFLPKHSLITRWRAAFRGYAEPDLPLHCDVQAKGQTVRDVAGRPQARFHLSFLQGAREVAQVAVTVLQDC
ncbi:AfsA-related hotdog domain-containing protein [Streptomyces cyslabdanicus]|uniref:AfsA-related hotdog domain-containing protein n=1 Tax=Streptomyces cyslabdanicus TaxID=1470456 RepID=UPI0040445221